MYHNVSWDSDVHYLKIGQHINQQINQHITIYDKHLSWYFCLAERMLSSGYKAWPKIKSSSMFMMSDIFWQETNVLGKYFIVFLSSVCNHLNNFQLLQNNVFQ